MEFTTLLVEKKDGIGKIILNRPKVLNAMNVQMLQEMAQAFNDMDTDDEVQIVILTGMGNSFSAGRDIKELGSAVDRPGGSFYAIPETISKPVIAAVNGFCYTGALELVECADLVIAADTATFADTHAKYGITHGGGGTQRLANIVGVRKAKELIFTCQTITAAEAERIGLVNRVVPADKLAEAAEQMARQIMVNNQNSVRRIKYVINQGIKHGMAAGFDIEAREWHLHRQLHQSGVKNQKI
ncbi:MAG: enoyl-CoA hydratase/isomerase family protein [Dehalococcoidales bacterium]|nr:enoyl-CoA hydratase/isomerase family protein [Dehalococcoidales bacterium]